MRLEPHRLVFIPLGGASLACRATDETGTTTKMTRLRGRCPKGQRLRSKPFGHWKTQTFIAGLRCFGLTAPFVVDRPMNRGIFDAYVETQLAPTLSKGDVVILDNLSAHKSPKAEALIKGRGAWMLFLPAYSPDLNPIEMAFSNSRPICELAPSEPSTASGEPSATSVISIRQPNAETTSPPPAMDALECTML